MHNVVGDVVDPGVAQLPVAQPRHGIVFVEALLGLCRRFDMPLDQRQAQRAGDLEGQHRLARPRVALYPQRGLQRDGGVDRDLQIARGYVAGCAAKALAQGRSPDGRRSCKLAQSWRSSQLMWPDLDRFTREYLANRAGRTN